MRTTADSATSSTVDDADEITAVDTDWVAVSVDVNALSVRVGAVAGVVAAAASVVGVAVVVAPVAVVDILHRLRNISENKANANADDDDEEDGSVVGDDNTGRNGKVDADGVVDASVIFFVKLGS